MYDETGHGDHGRSEVDAIARLQIDIDWLSQKQDWKGLRTIAMVESERHVDEKISVEKRFFIASINNDPNYVRK